MRHSGCVAVFLSCSIVLSYSGMFVMLQEYARVTEVIGILTYQDSYRTFVRERKHCQVGVCVRRSMPYRNHDLRMVTNLFNIRMCKCEITDEQTFKTLYLALFIQIFLGVPLS